MAGTRPGAANVDSIPHREEWLRAMAASRADLKVQDDGIAGAYFVVIRYGQKNGGYCSQKSASVKPFYVRLSGDNG